VTLHNVILLAFGDIEINTSMGLLLLTDQLSRLCLGDCRGISVYLLSFLGFTRPNLK